MVQVLAIVPIAGIDTVLVAVELVLESGALSAEHILNVVVRLASAAPPLATALAASGIILRSKRVRFYSTVDLVSTMARPYGSPKHCFGWI